MNRTTPPDPKYVKAKKKKVDLLLERGLVRVLLTLFPKASHQTSQEVRSILLIRSNAMGDAVVSSVFIRALTDVFPNASIDVLASRYNREVFGWVPRIREIHTVPEDNWEKWKMAWRLRGRYDLVFQTLFDENYLTRTLLARVIAAKGRLVARKRGTPMEQLADIVVPLPVGSYVGKMLSLLCPFTSASVESLVAAYPRLELNVPAELTDAAMRKIADAGLSPRQYVVLNISARLAFRALDTEQAKDIALRLVERGHQILVCCEPGDLERAKAVASAHSSIHVGDFSSLGEAIAAIRNAKLYVGPDTGSVHFAATGNVPCVVLFAPQAFYEVWSPYGNPFVSIQANPGQTVQEIDPAFVVDQADKLLRGEHRQLFLRPTPALFPEAKAPH